MPARQPRRSHGRTALAVVMILVSALIAGGLIVGGIQYSAQDGAATVVPGQVAPGDGTAPSPDTNDGQHVRLTYLKEQAQLVLDAHAQSLLNGSEDGWLAAFDRDLHRQMREWYTSLTGMGVSNYQYRIISGPSPDSTGSSTVYELEVAAEYCFDSQDPANCTVTDAIFSTVWQDTSDGFIMIDVAETESGDFGPRPWQTDQLQAVSGERTVVATTERYADRLDELLPLAEEAAANADNFAPFVDIDRYLVYIGGDDEYAEWFGGEVQESAVGYALGLGSESTGAWQETTMPVVIHLGRNARTVELISTLRHELGHVATLQQAPNASYQARSWWLNEGIAEYIDHGPEVDGYPRMADVIEYVGQGGCSGELVPPDENSDLVEGSGKYGCAYLGVNYTIDTYGQDAFFDFFDAVSRESQDPETVATDTLGVSYSDLVSEISGYIQSQT